MTIFKVATCILAGGLTGVGTLWMTDRDPPTTQVKSPEVLTPSIPPGGTLLIKYTLVRNRSCAVRTERLLFDKDDVRYPLEDIQFEASPGPLGPDSYTSRIAIPRSFAQGPGRYRTISTYTCNPTQRWFWPIVGQPNEIRFEVWGPPEALNLPIAITP